MAGLEYPARSCSLDPTLIQHMGPAREEVRPPAAVQFSGGQGTGFGEGGRAWFVFGRVPVRVEGKVQRVPVRAGVHLRVGVRVGVG